MDEVTIGRAKWLEERRQGIGGTDAAAILGLSRFKSQHDVFLEKTGQAAEKPDNEAMWWGRELEAVIAKRYAEQTGVRLENPGGIIIHPQHPELIGTPDRLAFPARGLPYGLEIKTSSAYLADQWGDAGTDAIPAAYLVQCLHYLSLTGFKRWDVAVLIGGNDFRIYTVTENLPVQESIRAKLCEWWRRYVLEREELPIDGSDGARRFLETRFARVVDHRLKATTEAEAAAGQLLEARGAIEAWELRAKLAENRLRAECGEAAGIDGNGWRLTWRTGSERKATAWRNVAEAMRDLFGPPGANAFETLAARFTETTPASRPFRFTAQKGGDK